MAVPFDTPVSAIEGIGPAAERLFQLQGVFTVYDLLRAPSPALHGAVAAVASPAEVRAWRQMAVVLEVATVTPQWAEALVKGGATSLTELRRLDLGELQTLFTAARDAGTIPDVPTTGQIVAMLTDSSLLDFAGAITGTVSDRDGNPVKDAKITAGSSEAFSDDRGRFRLRRLLLGRDMTLSISKTGLQTATVQATPLPTETVAVEQFTLRPEVALPPRASGQAAAGLNEANGDVLPQMQGQDVTSHEVPLASLRPGDLLTLTEFYANDRDAKLVSKLLEYDGSQFVVHWVRLPKTSLPAGAAIGDYFLKTPTGYRKVAMNSKKLNDYKKLLKVRRVLPPRPPATTAAERYRQAAETFALISGGQS